MWKEQQNNTKIFSITKKVKMKKLYCIVSGKYRKVEKSEISHILEKTLEKHYYKIILYLYQLKDTWNILVALLRFIRRNLMECQKKIIKNITKSESNFVLTIVNHHVLPDIDFNGNCLINNNISIHKKIINLYISYILNPQIKNLNRDFTLNNCLFGSVKLTKNSDLDK